MGRGHGMPRLLSLFTPLLHVFGEWWSLPHFFRPRGVVEEEEEEEVEAHTAPALLADANVHHQVTGRRKMREILALGGKERVWLGW